MLIIHGYVYEDIWNHQIGINKIDISPTRKYAFSKTYCLVGGISILFMYKKIYIFNCFDDDDIAFYIIFSKILNLWTSLNSIQ